MERILAFFKRIAMRQGQLRPWLLPAITLTVASVMLAMGVVRLAGSFEYNRTEISNKPEDLGISETKLELPSGITNIALFGIDARNEEFKGLSDSIMIISIDAVHNDIKLISILRDSLVEVEGYGYQKINAAYSLGGAELAIKTLNQTFDLNIRDYATVDFVSMAKIIDYVGGVEVEMTDGEVRNGNVQIRSMHIERGTPLDLFEESGVQHLNGTQAVAFARIRKTATIKGTVDDVGRTERQRLVMEQLFQKALEMDISKYPGMIRAMLPCMETSLSYSEIFKLAGLLANPGLTFKEGRIPTSEAIIVYGLNVKGLGSCKYYNLEYAAKMINAFVFEDISFEQYMEENGVDRTPWFTGKLNGKAEVVEEEEDGYEEFYEKFPDDAVTEDTTKPETDKETEKNNTSEKTEKPSATEKPEATTKPSVTIKPEQTTKPGVTVKPEETTKPSVKPEETVKPEVESKPEDNTGKEPQNNSNTGGSIEEDKPVTESPLKPNGGGNAEKPTPETSAKPTPEEPEKQESETPAEPVPETPEEPTPETPAEPVPESPEEPTPETPAEPVPETPEEPTPETPAEPEPEIPEKPTPEPPVDPVPESPEESTPETPTEPAPETPEEPAPETPVEPAPEPPVEPTPETPTEPAPEIPVEPTPEVPVGLAPETTVE